MYFSDAVHGNGIQLRSLALSLLLRGVGLHQTRPWQALSPVTDGRCVPLAVHAVPEADRSW